jgi:hypothetical protein
MRLTRCGLVPVPDGCSRHSSAARVLCAVPQVFGQKKHGDNNDMLRGVLQEHMSGIDTKPNVKVIAATNYPERLDPALIRRFAPKGGQQLHSRCMCIVLARHASLLLCAIESSGLWIGYPDVASIAQFIRSFLDKLQAQSELKIREVAALCCCQHLRAHSRLAQFCSTNAKYRLATRATLSPPLACACSLKLAKACESGWMRRLFVAAFSSRAVLCLAARSTTSRSR